MAELPAAERIILAIDTSREQEAERLALVAVDAGARFVKLGLELSSATSWRYCSELAANYGLDWVADAKLDDIPNTVAGAVKNIKALEYPPFAITMHTTAGKEAMRVAQEEAENIKMLGVTVLTSIKDEEAIDTQDQARVGTPASAIRDGADLLVIGRQITQAEDPAQAYEALVTEIEGVL